MSDATPATGTEEATTTETVETTEAPPAGDTPTVESLQAEVDKWKATSRKHEDRAKANAAAQKELDAVKAASMSDQEKAVALAVAQARAEAFAEVGGQLVDAAVRAAVAGRGIDADALLDGLDRSRFLDDGQVDQAAITAWVDRIVPAGTVDLGQGARGTTPPTVGPLEQALRHTVGL